MMKDIPVPSGWMQGDIERGEPTSPIQETLGLITNTDDTAQLLRFNPSFRDSEKEDSQHMIAVDKKTSGRFYMEEKKLAKAKARPPKKWFQDTLKQVMKSNPEYSKEQAQATVGAIWYKKMSPSKKTEVKKKMYPERYASLVKKAMDKLSQAPLVYPIGKEVLGLLQKALMAEFMQWDLYYAYKSQLKGLSRDPIAAHFADHASEEAQHIEVLQRYIVGMGETPTTERRPIPKIADNSIRQIIELQLQFEVEAVQLYSLILKQLGENSDSLRIEIEDILAQETEHMHDLQLLLRE